MVLLGGLNAWRAVEAVGLSAAVPDLATLQPPLLVAAYGLVCAIAFLGCAVLVWRRHPLAGRAALAATAAAFGLGALMRLGFGVSAEAAATLGFYAILNLLALAITASFAWKWRKVQA